MDRVSFLASKKIPFVVIYDFEGRCRYVKELSSNRDVLVKTPIFSDPMPKSDTVPAILKIDPIPYERYKKAFDKVIERIKKGETYLLNLTFPTAIELNGDLVSIFSRAKAPFKILYKNRFVCFSPERFVKIEGGKIFTYPMKGTIEATEKNAKEKILADSKEMAEHVMVVDLLRNDLSRVAKSVRVNRFRYIDEIEAGDKRLLQVSSEISGSLPKNWQNRLGEILASLLPAGSISGTPKISTIKIIKDTEKYRRGFFTGIFGVFDGERFDSAVMIRYIEKSQEGFLYKSGGGITIDSDPRLEYSEMLKKVYIPL